MPDKLPHPPIETLSYLRENVLDERSAKRSRMVGIAFVCIAGLALLWQLYGLLSWAPAVVGGIVNLASFTPEEMAEMNRFEWYAILLPAVLHLFLLITWIVILRKRRSGIQFVWLMALILPVGGLGLTVKIFIKYISALLP